MSDAESRILQLAARGEWITLEQTLKGIDKGDLGASETDPVGDVINSSLYKMECDVGGFLVVQFPNALLFFYVVAIYATP